jgi:hypothetical protein
VDLSQFASEPVAYLASQTLIKGLDKSPFFLDMGATAHISPQRSDFKSLCPISPHPVLGVGGSCIYAISIGTIKICISAGHKFMLENVLYVPSATIHLISVLTLNRSSRLTSHFNNNSFWLTNSSGATVLRGTVYENRKLYGLPLQSACTVHSKNDAAANIALDLVLGHSPTVANYASCKPNVETWHRRLGHCNTETIIDMAWRGAVKGMAVDLSSSPPKCNAAFLETKADEITGAKSEGGGESQSST